MAAVDTNVLVRLLVSDDAARTKRAAAFLESHRPVWISTVVLVETVWVLTTVYRWSKPKIIALLQVVVDSREFALQSAEAVRAATDVYVSGKADFADCLALELARTEGHLPFASFDKATVKLPDAVEP